MRKYVLVLVLVFINTIGVGFIAYKMFNKSQKVVYIDNVKVFSEFHMTQDLGRSSEEKYKPLLVSYDSLVKKFSLFQHKLSGTPNKEKIALQQMILRREEELKQVKLEVRDKINRDVWGRLNGYIKDFGIEREVDLILGAQGQGNIMFAKDYIDLTDEFVQYANQRYEGN